MASGLNPNIEIVERFLASVATGNMVQPFVAPCDLDVVGLVASLGTAPGGSSVVTINVNNSPTSQLSVVSPFNLWTTANVPSITGTSTKSFTTSAPTVVNNKPYALNYPLPGPSGASGYVTAQSTTQTTQTPVVTPPTIAEYQISALVAPDNTYTDLNGVVGTSAARINAGDVLTFVLAGGGVGSAANLSISLFLLKR